MTQVIAIDTTSLGDRSYLVGDGSVAFVVDPQRDVDRVLDLAARHGLRITDVFETHIHNDYLTGGLALARLTGAAYHVNAADPVSFDRTPIHDGGIVEVGDQMRVRALATPGHTFTHLSYVLETPDRAPMVFTGGSLLFGSTGRPDLLGPSHTDRLARAQYASAHLLADVLPDDAEVFPTHGFGSFCAVTQSAADRSTIGAEKRTNPVLTSDEKSYVDALLAGLDVFPAYYAHMGPANTAGPAAVDLTEPRAAEPAELRARIDAGEWVVDLRSRTAFAAGHLVGSLNFGLDGSFATYLGWLIPWGTPVSLLGDSAAQVTKAQRELVRIGIERVESAATGTPEEWSGPAPLGTLPRASFADLAAVRHHRPVAILDVRRNLEWAGEHVNGAVHVPLHDLLHRLDAVPRGEVWVHCQSGYRASIAASVLAANGRRVVVIDDEFDQAARAGLPMVA
ncbi:MBL fold metallo-hydrolase [Lentzea sp. NPDC034063]|uniref:MBL fold metallo-hydrolase n=1 Tax=unclassified Lentzea TaxID=2643253 RepID=UPI0033D2DD4D